METKVITVLVVESDLSFARFLRESLSNLTGNCIQLETSRTLEQGLAKLQRNNYSAVLLNCYLQDSQGLPTFRRLHNQAQSLPVVILTTKEDESLALEAVRAGAQDYLVKSKVDGKILSRVVRYAIERKRTGQTLLAANAELLKMNDELAHSEEALRQALDELRASHQELKAAQLQLIQAEKLECVGTLAAGVAHEVKNPLQTILMGLAYLGKNLPVSDETIGLVLTDMREAVKRADGIVRDLLYLSAAKQIEMKPQNLNEVVEHSLCFVNYDLTRSRILVTRDLAKDLPPVKLDKPKMEQVLINVFMNAIQAMPNGGTLSLSTRRAEWSAELGNLAPERHRFEVGEPVAIVEIEDTGSGVPREKLSRIFEPFFTTKPNGVGTGLGLPVSKQIIDLHGGTIKMSPGSRGGARVTLILKSENSQ